MLNYSCILIGSYLRSIGEEMYWDAYITTLFSFFVMKTNIFYMYVSVYVFSNLQYQRRRKNVVKTSLITSRATFSLLPHFDVICDQLCNWRITTSNLFVEQTGMLCFSKNRVVVNFIPKYNKLSGTQVKDISWAH